MYTEPSLENARPGAKIIYVSPFQESGLPQRMFLILKTHQLFKLFSFICRG